MNNEPIIIDGVDVAECQYLYFAIEDSIIDYKEYPRCSIGEAFTNNACKNSNCYYKQLKRKEKECEKAKNIIKGALSDFCGEYGTKEYIKLTKEAKELGIEVKDYV